MDDLIDFWMCSCCGQVYDGALEQPINKFGNELYECALCDVVNQERLITEKGGDNGICNYQP